MLVVSEKLHMCNSQLNRALELARRTGDRLIYVQDDEAMVIMGLDEYENLMDASEPAPVEDMSEKEMLDKINRDIAAWRAHNVETEGEDEEFENFPSDSRLADDFAPVEELAETEPTSNLPVENLDNLPQAEEERFYLEPVE